jgi:hypothetical protein
VVGVHEPELRETRQLVSDAAAPALRGAHAHDERIRAPAAPDLLEEG